MNGVQSEIKQGMYEIEKQANIEDRETKTPLVTEQANSTISKQNLQKRRKKIQQSLLRKSNPKSVLLHVKFIIRLHFAVKSSGQS